MLTHKQILFILLHLVAVFMLPLLTKLITLGGNLPVDFFDYPIISTIPKPGFNLTFFVLIGIGCLMVSMFILFPGWFGFKKIEPEKSGSEKDIVSFPVWFWIGFTIHVATLVLSWGKFESPEFLIRFQLIPLWWGFVMILDGIVYKRNQGSSLLASRPQTLIAVAMSSSLGWMYYAYLNFYVQSNWFYPAGSLVSSTIFFTYAIIGAAAFWPLVFEWYSLLNTFQSLKRRYRSGPKIQLNRTLLVGIILIGWALTALVSFWPNALFFGIWLGPMISLMAMLSLIGIWTPFTPISREGNWGPLILIAVAALVQGFFWEMWNYFSAIHTAPIITGNPAFWKYSIPYVDVARVFEMPLLGYFGYLPFGIYCWVWWLMFTFLMGTPHQISLDTDQHTKVDNIQLSIKAD